MPESIKTKSKNVKGRSIVALEKEYNGETYEFYIPEEEVPQVMLMMLSEINAGKDTDEQFVLARKSQIGIFHD